MCKDVENFKYPLNKGCFYCNLVENFICLIFHIEIIHKV